MILRRRMFGAAAAEQGVPLGIDLVQYCINNLGYQWEDGYAYNTSGVKSNWGGTWACLPLISLEGIDYFRLIGNRKEYCCLYDSSENYIGSALSYPTNYVSNGYLVPRNTEFIGISRRNSSIYYELYAYKGEPLTANQQPNVGTIYKPEQTTTGDITTVKFLVDGFKSFRWLRQARGWYAVYDVNGTQLYKQSTTNVYNDAQYDLPEGAYRMRCSHWYEGNHPILIQLYDVAASDIT